jgi:ribosomal protein S18 acetylase RimI-like enzyme
MVTIRRAQIGDIPAIRSVLALTWRDTYSSFLSESFIEKVSAEWHAPKVLEGELNRPSTFLGVAEGSSHDIIGMVTARLHEDLLLIARLYVLPGFQRQGLGKQLIEASYRAFPQARRVRLQVEEQNPKGRSFYCKLGFREIGIKTDELANTNVNSVVLEKRIDKRA